ncbi:tRNA (adenosine(37)-N6)-threonylcarbamoyltransferase complex dimerization subunit type 1 TsaB [Phenylobacterium sp.]|uniref:tRNA (adenosine(37)-N6)-threonylcarbamoyltransferase complex dimerization subunit type 1 TsaB n=1 Tax=Phenylobacterium sp. TaxID=1871053 RepID=UPI0035ADCD71
MVLGLDTCLNACACAVVDDGRVLARAVEPMARGHQERLAPLARDVMAEAGLPFDRLDRIGVTVGPGSFTGLRVGLAFAKGLAGALDAPLVGVGALEALAAGEPEALAFAAIDARRGQVYLQAFRDGAALMAPDVLDLGTAAARIAEFHRGEPAVLVGSGGPLLAEVVPGARLAPGEGCDPVAVAKIAAARAPTPVRPLYLRAPDARLPQA